VTSVRFPKINGGGGPDLSSSGSLRISKLSISFDFPFNLMQWQGQEDLHTAGSQQAAPSRAVLEQVGNLAA
jgi:peroxiredoxin